jgi:hypothetical protein
MVSMEWVKTLYITTAVFGLSVIIVDLFSAFSGASDSSEDDAGSESGENAAADDSSAYDNSPVGSEEGSDLVHIKKSKGDFILTILGSLRRIVYFSFGFGATGWFALTTGKTIQASVLWSVPVGIFLLLVSNMIRKIQTNELDSQFKKADLIMGRAEVIIKIGSGKMGKIRMELGGTIVERFARANNNEESFKTGDKVRIANVLDDVVIVEIDNTLR